jgi:hypothetical protein
MYIQETLARDRHSCRIAEAREERIARQAAELSRIRRVQRRAERRLLRAWSRADEIRAMIEAAR